MSLSFETWVFTVERCPTGSCELQFPKIPGFWETSFGHISSQTSDSGHIRPPMYPIVLRQPDTQDRALCLALSQLGDALKNSTLWSQRSAAQSAVHPNVPPVYTDLQVLCLGRISFVYTHLQVLYHQPIFVYTEPQAICYELIGVFRKGYGSRVRSKPKAESRKGSIHVSSVELSPEPAVFLEHT